MAHRARSPPPPPLPPAAALAFVKSTPRPGVRSFRLVSFAYNHAQSPLLVHPFLLPSLRPLSILPFPPGSPSPSSPFLSFFRVAISAPPPVFTYSSSSSASPRLSLFVLCVSSPPVPSSQHVGASALHRSDISPHFYHRS